MTDHHTAGKWLLTAGPTWRWHPPTEMYRHTKKQMFLLGLKSVHQTKLSFVITT